MLKRPLTEWVRNANQSGALIYSSTLCSLILYHFIVYLFDRACPHAETGVPRTAAPPEHAAPGLGLWSTGRQCGGNVHQTDGSTICKSKVIPLDVGNHDLG